ncbi:BTB/POZ domain-containing protein [Acorus calamus]|uniref:BTB/POZ domain-containing protein n=1 Tax=Acorus calamus TaxID=4465 RepID=A0AAV9DUG2_ACOCL|nr:BTB/POZ domain-containing protein [Acorus calamus]
MMKNKERRKDMLVALEGILHSRNENILRTAADVTVHVPEADKESWKILEETDAVNTIINAIQDYIYGIQTLECFLEMSSLLKIVLQRFPYSRPYIWDILGWLATHCDETFHPIVNGEENCLDILISWACFVAVESMCEGCYSSLSSSHTSQLEPLARAVLLMMTSPSKYISLKARHHLSEALRPHGYRPLENLLDVLKSTFLGSACGALDNLKTVMNSSRIIKLPICWEALVKLVRWFYSGTLPRLEPRCQWKNMDRDQQQRDLQTYVELSWIAELWFVDVVRQVSMDVILSCLKSKPNLSLNLMKSAANISQWDVVQAAATHLVPLYPQMRDA